MEDFSSENSTDTPSAKAIKSRHLIKISGGSFKIDSSDDSIHSNSDIEIGGGSFELSSGDDGIHADDQLIINNGTVNLLKSYEGLEATVITLNGGNIDITASDDGLNAAGGRRRYRNLWPVPGFGRTFRCGCVCAAVYQSDHRKNCSRRSRSLRGSCIHSFPGDRRDPVCGVGHCGGSVSAKTKSYKGVLI